MLSLLSPFQPFTGQRRSVEQKETAADYGKGQGGHLTLVVVTTLLPRIQYVPRVKYLHASLVFEVITHDFITHLWPGFRMCSALGGGLRTITDVKPWEVCVHDHGFHQMRTGPFPGPLLDVQLWHSRLEKVENLSTQPEATIKLLHATRGQCHAESPHWPISKKY